MLYFSFKEVFINPRLIQSAPTENNSPYLRRGKIHLYILSQLIQSATSVPKAVNFLSGFLLVRNLESCHH
ncbi:hypothetical protein GQ457_08G015640 [Hibiscus cannabinus]